MHANLLMTKKSKGRNLTRSSGSLPSMSVIGSAQPDVMRMKVYKPSLNQSDKVKDSASSKKFCIDPHISSYRTMQYLIAQAFDIKSDFTINAIQRCPVTGHEQVTPIWSDGDLDLAIKNVKSGAYLRLRYELTVREEGLDDWDFVALNDFSANIRWFNVDSRSVIATAQQVTKKPNSTLNKAINWMYGGHDRLCSKPVGENDFKKFLDTDGRLVHANELRQAIYEGGIEPSFRKVVWRHLLNIFPTHMKSFERIEYLNEVSRSYDKLKRRWQRDQDRNEEIKKVSCAIHKDVLRTDRTFGFYAASSDTNVNLQSLFNILTTYCVSHPKVTYCQGMNEYASTLLYVMREEALAYICFCSIMRRIRANFATDGVAIATKFHHLKVILRAVDPVFWSFFESCDAVNLFYTYRWLLLECKREFPFNDALRVLEVMWATLPIDSEPPALSELPSLPESSPSRISKITRPLFCHSLHRRALSCPELSIKDRPVLRSPRQHSSSVTFHNFESSSNTFRQGDDTVSENGEYPFQSASRENQRSASSSSRSREKSFENSFSLSEISEFDSDHLSICTSSQPTASPEKQQSSGANAWLQRLPTGDTIWLEEENSFLLFLCVALLLSHRNHLLKQKNLDEQEISIYFDQFRRRHRADRLLPCARSLYGQYIQWARKKRMVDDLNEFSAS